MKPNRYPGYCHECGGHVAKNAGTIKRDDAGVWRPVHLPCARHGAPAVDVIAFSSGHTATRNRNGKCIDAPCCGCCTI